ncbi:hypothetical protein ACFSOZ_14425 [Mesorhizobium newzealandense]|uniref:DUF3606 domain-containing protein n=1 Tax=Mesorhizobium newzealandense TaxID=1300302 RepID=A0ABW4U8K2_9HYPH
MAEERYDGGGSIATVPSEEKNFRVLFLSKETGLDADSARELVDKIERDGAALLHAARQMKATRDDRQASEWLRRRANRRR